MSGGYYGVLFDTYWTGPTGRAIRRHGGKDAQVLGVYLISNSHANMLGLYHLPPDDVRYHTGLSFKAIEKALGVMDTVDYATFDAVTAFVWVREMYRFRLGLHKGEGLNQTKGHEDKKIRGVNRLYETLEDNPFLAPFFDTNHKRLCLERRRAPEDHQRSVPFRATPYLSGLRSPSKGLQAPSSQVQVQVQVPEISDQRSGTGTGKAPRLASRPSGPHGTPDENRRVIRSLIADVVQHAPPDTDFVSLKDLAKEACTKEKLAADPEVIGDALEQVLARFRRSG